MLFVRDKKSICYFHDDYNNDGRLCIWLPAPTGVQDELVGQEPDRFFVPPYLGYRGWVGVNLDVDPDWDELASMLEESYRMVAPKKLIALLDE